MKKTFVVLTLLFAIQIGAYFMKSDDMGRLMVGQDPHYSTSFGLVVFDGGSKQFWGLGYTINLSYTGSADSRKLGLYHLSYWYWIPFCNLVMNPSFFLTEGELEKYKLNHIE